ncbi:nuclear transport factor 2 family protein [Streptomyces stelliscabiei]
MSEFHAVVDRFEIEALRAEITDAVMMRDYDRAAALFTPEGSMRWPHIDREFVGRQEIPLGDRVGAGALGVLRAERPPGVVRLDGDTAVGRAYVQEFGRMRDGGSHLNYAVYHDRYRRTSDGWKFDERRLRGQVSRPHPADGCTAHLLSREAVRGRPAADRHRSQPQAKGEPSCSCSPEPTAS